MNKDKNAEINFIDVQQQLNCSKMAAISSVNSIQNPITEHVLNNELTNFVATTNKRLDCNLKTTDTNLDKALNETLCQANQLNGHFGTSINSKNENCQSISSCKSNYLVNLKSNKLKDEQIRKLNDESPNEQIDLIDKTEQRSRNFILNYDDKVVSSSNVSKAMLSVVSSDYFSALNDSKSNPNKRITNNDLKKNDLNNFDTTNQLTNKLIDVDSNEVDSNQVDSNNNVEQLRNIFKSIRKTITKNTKSKTNPSMTNLLIEKNFLFNQFYNSSTGDKSNGNLGLNQIDTTKIGDLKMTSFQLNGQCNLKEYNQLNNNFIEPHSDNQIFKLITDDYFSEHSYDHHLINSGHHMNPVRPISSPIMINQTNRHKNNGKISSDEDDNEIFEDVVSMDNLDIKNEQSTGKQSNDCSTELSDKLNNYVDIETMKTQLAKLKLTKDFDNSNSTNSPVNDELNDDNENDFYDAIDEEIERIPLIRSTSLKTGKTKELGHEKKIVRFADAMGLDLAKIKNISQEDLPNVPASAFIDLKMAKKEVKEEFFNNQLSCSPVRSNQLNYWNQPNRFPSTMNGTAYNQFNKAPLLSNGIISAGSDLLTPSNNWPVLVPEFVQPFTQFNFLERVRQQKVCLESCVVSSIGNNLSIDCIIRVQNIAFEKVIMVRYTSNNWLTWLDSLASFIPNSSDGQTDKFSVKFYIKSLCKGQRVKFAIKYLANSTEYWDNNLGIDYCLLYKT